MVKTHKAVYFRYGHYKTYQKMKKLGYVHQDFNEAVKAVFLEWMAQQQRLSQKVQKVYK